MTPAKWMSETHRGLTKAFDKSGAKKVVSLDDAEIADVVHHIVDIFRDMGLEKPKELVELFDDLKDLAKKATNDLQEIDFEAEDDE